SKFVDKVRYILTAINLYGNKPKLQAISDAVRRTMSAILCLPLLPVGAAYASNSGCLDRATPLRHSVPARRITC
ncbi:hypothetical protein ACT3TJ_12415, partial [Halomonas sp. AOP30-A1-24]|uniref:hypothetical protein n=1 Tax=Halomonas sp. AOP30-A1-24 TaxID=3457698 RepID=UPI00403411A1